MATNDNSMSDIDNFILGIWNELDVYKRIQEKDTHAIFNFMDGPPFVSSDTLHWGHLLIGSIKDIVLKWKQLNGYHTNNKIGFDCHGLPIEMKVDKI